MKRSPIRRKANPERADRRRQFHDDVLARDRQRCLLCGKRGTDPHHITYRSQGGPDESWNGVTLCRRCHVRVHDEGGRKWRPILYELAVRSELLSAADRA